MYSQDWLRLKYPKPLPVMCIFIMIMSVAKFAVAQPSTTDCSLGFQFSSSANNSSCEGGDWGRFLHDKCCNSVFEKYLYALGQRANQTGNLFLNSSEQNSCLNLMKRFEEDVFGCGIEKLTSGAGACSDYTVADVTNKLGDQLTSFNENCKFMSSDAEWHQMCGTCVKSWEDIKGPHLVPPNPESEKTESDICRFSVMVSLTSSRIQDEKYIEELYTCLAKQDIYIGESLDRPKNI